LELLFQNYHLENEKYLKIPESFPQKKSGSLETGSDKADS